MPDNINLTPLDAAAVAGYLDGFAQLFRWGGNLSPSTYREIIDGFPAHVRDELAKKCDERGFPNAVDDHEWEYMRAAAEEAADLSRWLIEQTDDVTW